MPIRTTAPEHESRSKTRPNTSRPAPSRRSSLDRRDHVARRRRPRATHAERRACRALDPDARLRLEVRSRRSPWTPPFAPIISPERFRSTASRQRHPRSSPQTSSTRGGFPRFRDAPDHGLPPPSRRSMARRDTANAPARREPKRALPSRAGFRSTSKRTLARDISDAQERSGALETSYTRWDPQGSATVEKSLDGSRATR